MWYIYIYSPPSTWRRMGEWVRSEGRGRRGEVWGRRGDRLSVRDEGRDWGSELGSYLDLDLDPDPRKIWFIRIRKNDTDPLDPDPQHCLMRPPYPPYSPTPALSSLWVLLRSLLTMELLVRYEELVRQRARWDQVVASYDLSQVVILLQPGIGSTFFRKLF